MKLYWMRDNLELNSREVYKKMPVIRAYDDVPALYRGGGAMMSLP